MGCRAILLRGRIVPPLVDDQPAERFSVFRYLCSKPPALSPIFIRDGGPAHRGGTHSKSNYAQIEPRPAICGGRSLIVLSVEQSVLQSTHARVQHNRGVAERLAQLLISFFTGSRVIAVCQLVEPER